MAPRATEFAGHHETADAAHCLTELAKLLILQGKHPEAQVGARRRVHFWRTLEDEEGLATALNALAIAECLRGDRAVVIAHPNMAARSVKSRRR